MSHNSEIEVPLYYAPGVTAIIASSFYYFLNLIDESTVLKYLYNKILNKDTKLRLDIEAQIYIIFRKNNRIIEFEGIDSRGILALKWGHVI